MIEMMNKATGNNVPLNPNAPPSRADQIRAIAKTATAPAEKPQDEVLHPLELAKGFVKGAGKTLNDVQNLGKTALGTVGIDTSKMGIKSLENIKYNNLSQDVGGKLEGIAELGIGGITDAFKAKTAGKAALEVVESKIAKPIVDKTLSTVEKVIPSATKEGAAKKTLDELVDATSGVADKKARISALEQTGMDEGGTKQTLGGGIKTAPDKYALDRAKSVEGIIKPGASPVDNLSSINKEISRISEHEVGPLLEKAGSITPISEKAPGWSPIVQRLVDIEKPDIIKADSTLDKTYDLVRARMLQQIEKQPPTVNGLWEARKSFDQVVREQFGDVAFDSEKNTAIKRAVNDMRREVNSIIGERAPEYKDFMDKLSNMYDARYNIAEQFQSLVNAGGAKAFKALNPKTFEALKWGGSLAGYESLKHTVAPFLPGI